MNKNQGIGTQQSLGVSQRESFGITITFDEFFGTLKCRSSKNLEQKIDSQKNIIQELFLKGYTLSDKLTADNQGRHWPLFVNPNGNCYMHGLVVFPEGKNNRSFGSITFEEYLDRLLEVEKISAQKSKINSISQDYTTFTVSNDQPNVIKSTPTNNTNSSQGQPLSPQGKAELKNALQMFFFRGPSTSQSNEIKQTTSSGFQEITPIPQNSNINGPLWVGLEYLDQTPSDMNKSNQNEIDEAVKKFTGCRLIKDAYGNTFAIRNRIIIAKTVVNESNLCAPYEAMSGYYRDGNCVKDYPIKGNCLNLLMNDEEDVRKIIKMLMELELIG